MKLVRATLGVHSDDTTRVPPVIGRENATLYAELTYAIGRGNSAIDGVEFGILQLVSVD